MGTLTNEYYIQKQIKCGLKSGNVCHHSMHNPLSSSFAIQNIKMYRNIILPVVLYGCETWSLALREERRLRVFENGVLRGMFGDKGDEVTGEWKKLHNEELNDLYCQPNIIRVIKIEKIEMGRACSACGGEERCR